MSLIVANQCALKTSRFPVLWLYFSVSLSVFSCVLFCLSHHLSLSGLSSSSILLRGTWAATWETRRLFFFFFFFTLAKTRRSPNRSKLLQQPSAISYLTIIHGMLQWSSMHHKHLSLKLVLQCKIYISFFVGVISLLEWTICEANAKMKRKAKAASFFFLSFPSFFFSPLFTRFDSLLPQMSHD